MEEGAHEGEKTAGVKHGRQGIMGIFWQPVKPSLKLTFKNFI